MKLVLAICTILGALGLCVAQGIQGKVTISGGAQITVTGHLVTLAWDASQGATAYNVYRGTVHGGPYSQVDKAVPSTTYADTQITHSQTFYYVVTAVNGNKESAYSNEAVAAVP
jgi:cellulose 1,4-beta-cellobiosidase